MAGSTPAVHYSTLASDRPNGRVWAKCGTFTGHFTSDKAKVTCLACAKSVGVRTEATHRPRSSQATGRSTPPRIIPASSLAPGLATIIVSLPDRTIRSRVFMVQVQPHGSVQVAFTSGDMITLSPKTMVGSIERPRPPLTQR